jgi:UDP-3-O-[3-hydroxymyristoyl] glucosamine N-acyltransferase
MIDLIYYEQKYSFGITNPVNVFDVLGQSNSAQVNSLSFLDSLKYVSELNNNKNITGVIVNQELKDEVSPEKIVFVVDDPRFVYYTIYNDIALNRKEYFKTEIDDTAKIYPNTYIANNNVKIGKGTIIYPNVTILEDVEIGDHCIIQSGTVIASEGFEYKRTSKGVLPVYHDGKVIIGNHVHVGANTCIDKGFSFSNTIIEDFAKIDNLVHVAHAVKIRKRAFVIASAMLAGSCEIGEDAWVGPNATIGHIKLNKNADVTFGSVVTKDVPEDTKVTGNFAVEHSIFLKLLKNNLKSI